jgi:hypothetical protein
MSAHFKLFLEHPVLTALVWLLMIAVYWAALKIGLEVIILALKAATWVVPKLDVVAKMIADLR